MDDDRDNPGPAALGFSLAAAAATAWMGSAGLSSFFCFFKSLTATSYIRCLLRLMGLTTTDTLCCPLR
jgi:hypothetical protein